ncbi:hypothetical protein AHAT_18840 [Agarivorans sp. Toyoura001]|nr:hypothetical protein AHAT_18840 [Agarivorans sp. Toyoura001]
MAFAVNELAIKTNADSILIDFMRFPFYTKIDWHMPVDTIVNLKRDAIPRPIVKAMKTRQFKKRLKQGCKVS